MVAGLIENNYFAYLIYDMIEDSEQLVKIQSTYGVPNRTQMLYLYTRTENRFH